MRIWRIYTHNIYIFTHDGIKLCAGQNTYYFFGLDVENTNIKFMGVYNSHGEKVKKASFYIEKEII